jgi:hypothetical protein
MVVPQPSRFKLTLHQTNDLIFRLEGRKYGRRLTSVELAEKASVPLDAVNCVEKQIPFDDRALIGGISRALGVSEDLLPKIAGYRPIGANEYARLLMCIGESSAGEAVSAECERLGLRRLYH